MQLTFQTFFISKVHNYRDYFHSLLHFMIVNLVLQAMKLYTQINVFMLLLLLKDHLSKVSDPINPNY